MAGSQPRVHLILGGARSGKTALGLRTAEALGGVRLYLATAEAGDDEMAARIAAHLAERGAGWTTREVPLDLAASIGGTEGIDICLVDCLTLWLSNIMHADLDVAGAIDDLCSVLRAPPCATILVSNEIGLGLVPGTALGRTFRDAQGRLNQRVAEVADEVTFVAAGLPMQLKGGLHARAKPDAQ